MHQPQKLGVGLILALALAATPALAYADPPGFGKNGTITVQQKKRVVIKQEQVAQQDARQTGHGGAQIGSGVRRSTSSGPGYFERRAATLAKSGAWVSKACKNAGANGGLGLAACGATAAQDAQVRAGLPGTPTLNGLPAAGGGAAAPGGGAAAPAPPPPDPQVVAAAVIARLQLPAGTPNVGPPPSANRWNMVAVGYPIWLWTDGATQLNDTDAEDGLSVSLDATATSTTFSMGDGSYVRCNPASARKWVRGGVDPGTPSPTCGYRYEKVSMKKSNGWKGAYTVTATTTWSIDWAAGGETGTVTVPRTASTQIPVGELQAVQVR